jgi:hypothetical protein
MTFTEQVNKLKAEKKTVAEIGALFGISESAVRQRLNAEKARARITIPPLADPTPEGFSVTKLSTTVDGDGVTRSQSVSVRPDAPDATPDLLIPEGHVAKGYSTLVDGRGMVRQQWVKTRIDEDKFRAMVEASCRAAAANIAPIARVKGPKVVDEDLMTMYPITDYHIGMLAWARETGEPWDLQIAEDTLMRVFLRMVECAPNSVRGVVAFMGDLLHFDSLKPVTPEHGHLLDADSRYQKVIEITVKVVRACIEMALTKHKEVYVEALEGNHDTSGSAWLRILLKVLYEKNSRVIVESSPVPYTMIEWGETFLGFHHGHLAKKTSLPMLFAARFPEAWGRTTRRYAHVGHLHHLDIKEYPGMTVNQHATLAAADAFAARGGWDSVRQVQAITYSRKTGEHARQTYIP